MVGHRWREGDGETARVGVQVVRTYRMRGCVERRGPSFLPASLCGVRVGCWTEREHVVVKTTLLVLCCCVSTILGRQGAKVALFACLPPPLLSQRSGDDERARLKQAFQNEEKQKGAGSLLAGQGAMVLSCCPSSGRNPAGASLPIIQSNAYCACLVPLSGSLVSLGHFPRQAIITNHVYVLRRALTFPLHYPSLGLSRASTPC